MPTIQPNAILHASWGYDQTNATFFRVLKVAGEWVTLQELKTDEQWRPDNSMTGTATPSDEPATEHHNGEIRVKPPIRRKLRGDYVKINSYMYARPFDGQPCSVSCYA